MLDDFREHIIQDFPFLRESKLLITVSGGIDSMVLLDLCEALSLDIAVAHCNFQLRGEESDLDTAFVRRYCAGREIPLFVKNFDTSAFAKATQSSTQIAARTLRYEWFESLAASEGMDYILTAHHLNDSLETLLINLGRGTGIDGLKGIPKVNGNVVRPLLGFTQERIRHYAVQRQLKWREDSSNLTDHYLRNHLRHHAIPALEEAQPNVLKGVQKTQEYLQQSAHLLNVYTQQLRQQYLTEIKGEIRVDFQAVQTHPAPEAVLYQLLATYGFTAWEDIYALHKAQSGKQIFSSNYRLVKDRTALIISPVTNEVVQTYIWHKEDPAIEGAFGKLLMEQVSAKQEVGLQEILVDASTITFPLEIRKWKEGDFFHPFGMKGKKKLSKFFKDEKLSLIAKERVWLLCSAGAIVWIIGYRADNRFKVRKNTKEITKITVL